MTQRLEVTKTCKLFIDGKFPRSESGRALPVQFNNETLYVSAASKKDLRDAVTAARKALPAWKAATPYLRAQIIYRFAEMLEGRRAEFARIIEKKARRNSGAAEVEASIDRLVAFAGWADKYHHILGGANPVSGPYHNFTIPEPVGVVGIIAPNDPPLLSLISLIAPALCAGNTLIAVGGETHPAMLATALLGEVCATSDIPPGVVNLLTGSHTELAPAFATHRDVDAIHAADTAAPLSTILREGAAENLKRVTIRQNVKWLDPQECHSPAWIEPLVEMKTIWHPSAT